ncbi:hypothetical protein BJX62DRAFT_245728 [Aspergillus germanicus]
MFDRLPAEIFLRVIHDLDPESRISLTQACRHAHATLTPYLRTIYRTRVIDLGEIKQGQVLNIRSRITHRQTLKFVEELVIQSSVSWTNSRGRDCLLHKCSHVETLGRELMPLFRALKRNALVSFTYDPVSSSHQEDEITFNNHRWQIHTCVPQSILGPRGYLGRHQRNIQSLHLTGPPCGSNADPSRRPSLSRFHRIRHLSWSLCTINHCIALRELFASPAVSHGLEELTLRGSYVHRALRDWKELQKPWSWMQARNVFAFKVLQLQPNENRDVVVFPALRKLTLYGFGFWYGVRDLVAALNMHHLRSLKLRSYYTSTILCTIAELAEEYNNNTNGTIPLTCLDITLSSSGDQSDTESFEQFFAVSPYLRDVYIQLDAFDQSSFKPHLGAIFTPKRQSSIRRFIYQRQLQVEGDVGGAWDNTDAPMVWDEEVRGLFAKAQMTHVGICDHLPTLMHNILLFPSRPTWEVLHIRTLPTIHEGDEKNNPHNPVFVHTFPPKAIYDSTGSPTSIDPTSLPYNSTFTKTEITDFLTFAIWAFGSGGLPCLRALVLGRVSRAYWSMSSGCGSGPAVGSGFIYLVRDCESGCLFRVCGSNSGQGPDKALMEEDLDFLSVV